MQVTEDGRAVLDIMPQKLLEELSVGDTALVKIGSFKAEMPLAEELISPSLLHYGLTDRFPCHWKNYSQPLSLR